jgi:hypothetical protein
MAVAAYGEGRMKGRPVLGAVLGIVLGLLGALIMIFVPKRQIPAAPPAEPHVPGEKAA